jgi:hypothetical protein
MKDLSIILGKLENNLFLKKFSLDLNEDPNDYNNDKTELKFGLKHYEGRFLKFLFGFVVFSLLGK